MGDRPCQLRRMPLPDLVIALIFVLGVKFDSPVRTFQESDMLMDAMSPEQAEYHNVSTPWWRQGGTSQGIADCGQCGCAFVIWLKMTDGALAVVCV